jgi:REP element-mobilizing transposase RayT
MDRFWLLTWTTYGTWLPGDTRGSVTSVRDGGKPRHRHNAAHSPIDAAMPGLEHSAQQLLKGAPVYLTGEQASVLLAQVQETAAFRGWVLLAAAIMRNHCHVVVGVRGDPEPEDLLRDLKSYGSRALNRQFTKPAGGTWWTQSGSRRKLPHQRAVDDAIDYVRS